MSKKILFLLLFLFLFSNTSLAKTAAEYRKIAEKYQAQGQYEKASQAYYKEAEIYKKIDYNAYLIEKSKGDALSSQVKIFTIQNIKTEIDIKKLAKYEPAQGIYIGAYIQNEKNGYADMDKFNGATGKKHAVFYAYHKYGQPFPTRWAQNVKNKGAAVHLALEPNQGLDAVQDDTYLREFAQAAKEANVPIFLRFASEMNGNWVTWNGDPSKYIEKFRLVSQVMKEVAPNVAMVWTPNSVPQGEIEKYYPGDEWVDWVGVNLYSVTCFNGDPSQPADKVNPLDLLDFVYKKYASRKPIQISEYAATHYSKTGDKDSQQFAINKMNMLYQGVRLLYPRVKAINWYSTDNTLYAHSINRRLNNFSLIDNPKVLDAYKEIIKDSYYLSGVVNGPLVEQNLAVDTKLVPLAGTKGSSSIQGMSWIKSYDPYISAVVYKLNGKRLSKAVQYPFTFEVDFEDLKSGKNSLEAVVFDSKGRIATRKIATFVKN